MTEEAVTIPSAGLRLSATVRTPGGLRSGERCAAFLVLHGFGSNKNSSNVLQPTKMLNDLGYVTLGLDMRGCGDSEGEFGRVICLEQVDDTRNALTFLAKHPAVDPRRIGLIGSSFGGAVAVYTGGVDERVAAVISNGGWGDGERKFRGQHKSPEEWARFLDMLKAGREHRAKTGKSLMVPRYEIVPIPPHLRHNLASNSVQMFPAETAQSMFDFRADDVVAALRPGRSCCCTPRTIRLRRPNNPSSCSSARDSPASCISSAMPTISCLPRAMPPSGICCAAGSPIISPRERQQRNEPPACAIDY